MSSFSLSLSKSGVRPLVALVGAGIKVAFFVASKSPGNPSSVFEASPTRLVHPIKASPTRLHQPDVFPLSVAVATVALFGFVALVMVSKGIMFGTPSIPGSNGGRDDEDPEPDGGAHDEVNGGPVNKHDKDDANGNGNGDEPPPPPDAGAINAEPREPWNWIFWLLLLLTFLSCYYWREITSFVISFAGERKTYYAIASLIGRPMSYFVDPALFHFISAIVIDFILCGKMPSWLPTSIAILTAMSTAYSALLFLNVIFRVFRLILSVPRAVYTCIAFIHRRTRRWGKVHYLIWIVWFYFPLVCFDAVHVIVDCARFPQTQSLVTRLVNLGLDCIVRLCWRDDVSLVQNMTTAAAPTALFVYRSLCSSSMLPDTLGYPVTFLLRKLLSHNLLQQDNYAFTAFICGPVLFYSYISTAAPGHLCLNSAFIPVLAARVLYPDSHILCRNSAFIPVLAAHIYKIPLYPDSHILCRNRITTLKQRPYTPRLRAPVLLHRFGYSFGNRRRPLLVRRDPRLTSLRLHGRVYDTFGWLALRVGSLLACGNELSTPTLGSTLLLPSLNFTVDGRRALVTYCWCSSEYTVFFAVHLQNKNSFLPWTLGHSAPSPFLDVGPPLLVLDLS
ncbi:hypothetical protein B0H16DRAFT_1721794 [Mycena metata]|uniref:Uncharacterized protein n=1 Tax=Mycena metata TaxID=1033252 RepID=A0AAD7J3D3_9AGAR|nr:hypothetical protein B0H16DRAFT_1721789 [Mycena metata]KAJ7756173.1 hypothetical protein B0H16DRAFT_1721794 [Mycena metata]